MHNYPVTDQPDNYSNRALLVPSEIKSNGNKNSIFLSSSYNLHLSHKFIQFRFLNNWSFFGMEKISLHFCFYIDPAKCELRIARDRTYSY